jgi:hypothetical protein
MSAGEQNRATARFLLRLAAGMAFFFGLGTVITNGLALLATEQARAELGAIPYPLFWFDFAMGWFYLGAGWGIGFRRAWAHPLTWSLAVLHSLSASGVWLWYFAGHPVAQGTLLMVLLREGFWVMIGLYLWRGLAPAAPSRR